MRIVYSMNNGSSGLFHVYSIEGSKKKEIKKRGPDGSPLCLVIYTHMWWYIIFLTVVIPLRLADDWSKILISHITQLFLYNILKPLHLKNLLDHILVLQ